MFSILEILDIAERRVITQLIEDRKYNLKDAVLLWKNSKTYKRLWNSPNDYSFLSSARIYQELERELDNDPNWFRHPFF